MALAGFVKWNPGPEKRAILRDALQVFDEFKDYLPLTGRQVFYRLVSNYGYEKSDAFANQLYDALGRARRAGWLPFSHLRDDGGRQSHPQVWADEAAFWTDVREKFDHFSRDRQNGQEAYVELFCESPGMMPQLTRAVFPYSVSVYGTRGYTGLAVIGEIARRALMRDTPTTILQIGDLDPSGVGIYETMKDDVETFVWQAIDAIQKDEPKYDQFIGNLGITPERCDEIRALDAFPAIGFERVALTWDQVEEYNLETAPPSHKDSRSKNWPYADTAQAEALPPDILQRVVREAVEEQFDMKRYWEEVDLEEADKGAIEERLSR